MEKEEGKGWLMMMTTGSRCGADYIDDPEIRELFTDEINRCWHYCGPTLYGGYDKLTDGDGNYKTMRGTND